MYIFLFWMRQFNSTIRVKKKNCSRCGKPEYIFSRGRCKSCATIEDTLAREEADVEQEEGLPELIAELDALVSRYVRLKAADKDNLVECYTCGVKKPVGEMQASHYIPRGCMLLRWDIERNIRCACKSCNEYKRGNLAEFGKRLEIEMPGVTEILLSESFTVYKYSRNELRDMILEYKKKLKELSAAL
jgi:hypothetical protein